METKVPDTCKISSYDVTKTFKTNKDKPWYRRCLCWICAIIFVAILVFLLLDFLYVFYVIIKLLFEKIYLPFCIMFAVTWIINPLFIFCWYQTTNKKVMNMFFLFCYAISFLTSILLEISLIVFGQLLPSFIVEDYKENPEETLEQTKSGLGIWYSMFAALYLGHIVFIITVFRGLYLETTNSLQIQPFKAKNSLP